MGKTAMIYMDYHATTPCAPEVIDAMLPWFGERFGNPHSSEHNYGWDAAEQVEQARASIASVIGARPREIVFTSGATEANNLAIKGVAYARKAEGRTKLISVVSEHKCVLESLASLKKQGFEVQLIGIKPDGQLNFDQLQAAITEKTALVSVMAANNEIGTVYPLRDIANLVHQKGAWVHSDIAQAFGRIPVNVDAMAVDLMSISSHKCYGPKGIGALYMRGRDSATRGRKVTLEAQMNGGGQERGVRSGTIPTPLAVGFGTAAELCKRDMEQQMIRLIDLRDRLLGHFNRELSGKFSVNGTMELRLPNNLNLSFFDIEAQALLAKLPQLAVSTGSACSSDQQEASHVLQAIGLDPAKIQATLRFGLGRDTTQAEIDKVAELMVKAIKN